MQRAPHRCPRCRHALLISWDMWGDYYVCHGCGFTAEDDDELKVAAAPEPAPTFPLFTTLDRPQKLWETIQRR